MKTKIRLIPYDNSRINKIIYIFLVITLFALFLAHLSYALPQDPTPQDGNVTFSQPNAQQLNIIQSSEKAIIDWRSFSIEAKESVDFQLSSANGITLNRVTGDQASSILGSLSSNGRLVLINPNGVIFGDTARVDVRGLVATTTDISNWDFKNGNLNFNLSSNSSKGVVINKGDITVAEGGLVALVAPGVSNSGTINARLGKVTLASGNTFTLDLYGDQLINLGIDNTVIKKATGMYGEELDALVSNSGKIYADGGIVTLKVATAQSALDQVINMDGIIQAKSISTDQEGTIILDGGTQGKVNVSGRLEASGKGWGGKGGLVRIAGKNVTLSSGARVDVSSNAGGGSAYIGGDVNGDVQNSYRTVLNWGSEVNAKQLMGWGPGGKVVVKGGIRPKTEGTLTAETVEILPEKETPIVPVQPKMKLTPKPEQESKPETKSVTQVATLPTVKPELKKPSVPEARSITRKANSPAIGIGGVQLAQNFNTLPSTIGIGGVDFGSTNITLPTRKRTSNGLGGVSTTSSSNASPISSLRSETFSPPGQAKRETQNPTDSDSKNSNPTKNISRTPAPASSTASNFLGLGGVDVDIQSRSNNVSRKNSQPKSALNLARSQRLKNL
jgi:filamentous hemagglutinin family protein